MKKAQINCFGDWVCGNCHTNHIVMPDYELKPEILECNYCSTKNELTVSEINRYRIEEGTME